MSENNTDALATIGKAVTIDDVGAIVHLQFRDANEPEKIVSLS